MLFSLNFCEFPKFLKYSSLCFTVNFVRDWVKVWYVASAGEAIFALRKQREKETFS